MSVTVETKTPIECKAGLLALPLTKLDEGQRLPARIAAIDKASGGLIQQVIDAGDFSGAKGQTVLVRPDGGVVGRRAR